MSKTPVHPAPVATCATNLCVRWRRVNPVRWWCRLPAHARPGAVCQGGHGACAAPV